MASHNIVNNKHISNQNINNSKTKYNINKSKYNYIILEIQLLYRIIYNVKMR